MLTIKRAQSADPFILQFLQLQTFCASALHTPYMPSLLEAFSRGVHEVHHDPLQVGQVTTSLVSRATSHKMFVEASIGAVLIQAGLLSATPPLAHVHGAPNVHQFTGCILKM